MGKLDDFEKRMILQGMSDKDISEYDKLLKRVHSNFLKRQHCYTTAIQFPDKYSEQAVRLINYGLESFPDGWFSTYSSYLYIGQIYERTGEYGKAYEAFLLAKEALGEDKNAYLQELSKELMWMKLHIDSFCYSKELEEYFLCFSQSDEFSKAFLSSEFRTAVVNIIISLHYGRMDEAKSSLEKAKRMCKADYKGRLYDLLKRHKYTEILKTTPEAIDFLHSVKI